MKVADVMITDVVTVSPDAKYIEAARLMVARGFSGLPVVDGNGVLAGVISEKDLFLALYPGEAEYALEFDEAFPEIETREAAVAEVRNEPVSRFMTRRVFSIPSNTPLLKAGAIMLAHHFHRLPVVDDGKLIGIVAREDIYSKILRTYLKI